jgi:hypothetical protein
VYNRLHLLAVDCIGWRDNESLAQKATCTRNTLALHGHSGVDDAHPAVNLIRIVKLVADVNDGTEIISNIKHNDASEAVVELKPPGGRLLAIAPYTRGLGSFRREGKYSNSVPRTFLSFLIKTL